MKQEREQKNDPSNENDKSSALEIFARFPNCQQTNHRRRNVGAVPMPSEDLKSLSSKTHQQLRARKAKKKQFNPKITYIQQ